MSDVEDAGDDSAKSVPSTSSEDTVTMTQDKPRVNTTTITTASAVDGKSDGESSEHAHTSVSDPTVKLSASNTVTKQSSKSHTQGKTPSPGRLHKYAQEANSDDFSPKGRTLLASYLTDKPLTKSRENSLVFSRLLGKNRGGEKANQTMDHLGDFITKSPRGYTGKQIRSGFKHTGVMRETTVTDRKGHTTSKKSPVTLEETGDEADHQCNLIIRNRKLFERDIPSLIDFLKDVQSKGAEVLSTATSEGKGKGKSKSKGKGKGKSKSKGKGKSKADASSSESSDITCNCSDDTDSKTD